LSTPHKRLKNPFKLREGKEERVEGNRYTAVSALRNFRGGLEVAKSDYYNYENNQQDATM
jgi:hypothetical protein